MNKAKGFTLLEMMVVVIIIGILASIALPRYSKTVENSRISEAQAVLGAIRSAQFRSVLTAGNYSSSIANLDVNIDNSSYFTFDTSDASSANPPESDSDFIDYIGRATRTSYRAGGGYAANYFIRINEAGNFSSAAPGSGPVPGMGGPG